MSSTERRGSPAGLRKFGLTMCVAFAVLAAILFLRDRSLWWIPAGLSGAFLLPALIFPRALSPVEKGWMAFAAVLGFVMTRVLLTLVFFLGVLPTGLILRLVGRDPIPKRPDPSRGSYWIDVTEDGPCSRPDKPY